MHVFHSLIHLLDVGHLSEFHLVLGDLIDHEADVFLFGIKTFEADVERLSLRLKLSLEVTI